MVDKPAAGDLKLVGRLFGASVRAQPHANPGSDLECVGSPAGTAEAYLHA